jgi:hypothetical protein
MKRLEMQGKGAGGGRRRKVARECAEKEMTQHSPSLSRGSGSQKKPEQVLHR